MLLLASTNVVKCKGDDRISGEVGSLGSVKSEAIKNLEGQRTWQDQRSPCLQDAGC